MTTPETPGTPGNPVAPTPSAAPVPTVGAGKPVITYDDFAKLDLRVATILAAEPHPNADRLLKLQVDLGSEQRQICAGIKTYYPDPAALVGRQVIVVTNLAPRTIRGEISNGMALAASQMNGEQVADVVLLTPFKPVPTGSKVS